MPFGASPGRVLVDFRAPAGCPKSLKIGIFTFMRPTGGPLFFELFLEAFLEAFWERFGSLGDAPGSLRSRFSVDFLRFFDLFCKGFLEDFRRVFRHCMQ